MSPIDASPLVAAVRGLKPHLRQLELVQVPAHQQRGVARRQLHLQVARHAGDHGLQVCGRGNVVGEEAVRDLAPRDLHVLAHMAVRRLHRQPCTTRRGQYH